MPPFPHDLAGFPSIASSPKSQVKTVGLLVNHDGFTNFFPPLLFDPQSPDSIRFLDPHDCVTLGLGRARDIAGSARVIDSQFDRLAAAHRFEPDLRGRPVSWAFEAAQVEPNDAVSVHPHHYTASDCSRCSGRRLSPAAKLLQGVARIFL